RREHGRRPRREWRDDRPARRRAGATGPGGKERRMSAPKEWRGRFFEDFEVGDVFRSRLGRTLTEVDNIWFTCLTLNTNQMHFNSAYAEGTQFGKPLMSSCLTLGVISGLSVPDTSENGTANLAWTDIKLPNP